MDLFIFYSKFRFHFLFKKSDFISFFFVNEKTLPFSDHPLLPIFHNDKQGWHPIPKESQHYYKNKEKLDYYYYPAEYDYYEYYDELNSIYGPLEPPPASVYKSSENSTTTTTTTEKWIIPPPIAPTLKPKPVIKQILKHQAPVAKTNIKADERQALELLGLPFGNFAVSYKYKLFEKWRKKVAIMFPFS